jgi:A/G-specific adenine glycosylase
MPILDGNVIRVLSRVFEVDGPVDKAATRRELWAWAEAVLPEGRPGDFNQALMDLGATVCTPTSPRCSGCPLAMDCGANSTGRQGELPVGGKRQAVRFETRVAVALVRSDGRFLVRQRPEGGLLPRLWELPGHEVPEGSTADAEASGMAAELGGGPVELCGRSEHRFSHRHWTTDVYRGPSPGGDGTWVSRDELAALGLPTVSRKAIDLALGGAPTQLPLL